MTEMLNEVIGVDRWYNLRIATDKATGLYYGLLSTAVCSTTKRLHTTISTLTIGCVSCVAVYCILLFVLTYDV